MISFSFLAQVALVFRFQIFFHVFKYLKIYYVKKLFMETQVVYKLTFNKLIVL